MFIEITITAVIVIVAGYLLYKNLKIKSRGKCDCCSTTNCPYHNIKKKKS
ncbi:FeoB-associated Cys-rich membrane protein [Clostridium sp. HV4-5-A1G]|nr:FeoB-associated Cys-rich membrane protein [Clostridium sp. HV4-5-A1G]